MARVCVNFGGSFTSHYMLMNRRLALTGGPQLVCRLSLDLILLYGLLKFEAVFVDNVLDDCQVLLNTKFS